MSKTNQVLIICKKCGKHFTSAPSNFREFCSKDCWYESRKVYKNCEICEKPFQVITGKALHCCSNKCKAIRQKNNPDFAKHLEQYSGYWKGKKRGTQSKETIRKRSDSFKKRYEQGYINPLLGKTPWNKGIKTPEEVRLKLIESHKGQVAWNKLNRTQEEIRAIKREYRRANPAKFKAYYHNKRLLRKDLKGSTIQLVYEDNIKKYGTLTCYLCLNPIIFGKDQLEHKIPVSRGGSNDYDNLGVSCKRCNNKKGAKTVDEYLAVRE